MAQHTELGILGAHPTAVIANLYARRSAPAHLYLYARGTGVKGVLYKLLDYRGGPVDHLSRGHLLGHQRIEDANRHGRVPTSLLYTGIISLTLRSLYLTVRLYAPSGGSS